MIEKKLPKPMFGEDIEIPEIKAEVIINTKTGSLRRYKEPEPDPIFPHTTFPTMGSAFTPSYAQGHIDCEIIKTKARDMMKYGTPSLLQIEQVFYRDMFPKNVRFQCSDCPHLSPFLYITDMIGHGVKYHMRPLEGVLNFLVRLMEDIERR